MARKTSFYYSFLVLPESKRKAIIAVWDFCRAVDDAVDENGSAEGRRAIEFWRAELARCYGGDVPETDEGRRLQPFVRAFGLPREAFDDMIDGVAMDLDTSRYQTFDDLFEYCRRVASAVGMICIRIFGCDDKRAADYALYLGVALQLTNILRDMKDDLSRGRVYVPLDELAVVGCRIEDLEEAASAGRSSMAVRRLVERECGRAREFYRQAIEVRPARDRGKLVAAEIMRAVYFETLMQIEKRGYEVFGERIRVGRPRQAAIALRQWLCPA
jgi:phytoene synthase